MFKNTSTFFNSFILEHHGCTLGTSRKELITINMFAVATVDFGKSENRFGPPRVCTNTFWKILSKQNV